MVSLLEVWLFALLKFQYRTSVWVMLTSHSVKRLMLKSCLASVFYEVLVTLYSLKWDVGDSQNKVRGDLKLNMSP